MLTNYEIKAIAKEVVRLLNKQAEAQGTRLVDINGAAKIMGLSKSRIRQIKDRLPCVKTGDTQQARLMFDRDKLVRMVSGR